MKRLYTIALLLTGSLWAQSSLKVPDRPMRSNPPNASQQYCAGFIARRPIARVNHIVASKEAPHEDQFAAHSVLFVGGPSLKIEGRYSILRESSDPNREDFSPDQEKKLVRLGHRYAEIGWMTVHAVQGDSSVATFDFACDTAIAGDIVVPYEDKPSIAVREMDAPIDQFQPSRGVSGHIWGSKDSIGLLGTGSVVYIDYGSEKGAKVGDYMFVRRGYSEDELNRVDRLSDRVPRGAAPEAANPVKITATDQKQMPSHILGEVLLLDVRETASTALVMRSLSEIQLGDTVEAEDGAAPVANANAEAAPHAEPCTPSPLWRRALFLGHKCK